MDIATHISLETIEQNMQISHQIYISFIYVDIKKFIMYNIFHAAFFGQELPFQIILY